MATAKKKGSGTSAGETAPRAAATKAAPVSEEPPAAPAKAVAKSSTPSGASTAARGGRKAPTTTTKASKGTVSEQTQKTESKETFDKKFLDEQRTLLLEERSRYVRSAETLKAEADSLIEGREPGDVQFDEEGGEGDTLAVERERDLALSAHARAAVEEIDAALARLEAGNYGICVVSGKPIPKERLRAIPWASERVEYKAGGFGTRR